MNERIHDLGRKATEWCVSQFNPGDDFDAMWEEKFAELIVKECADAVLGFRNQFGDSAHAEIREHFGVES